MRIPTITRTPVASVWPVPATQVLAALEAFWHADAAAEEANADLTRAQSAGVEDLPPGVEFLLAEADARYEALLKLVGLDEVVASLTLSAFDEDITSEYVGRRRRTAVPDAPPVASDWRASGPDVDWSRGRR